MVRMNMPRRNGMSWKLNKKVRLVLSMLKGNPFHVEDYSIITKTALNRVDNEVADPKVIDYQNF